MAFDPLQEDTIIDPTARLIGSLPTCTKTDFGFSYKFSELELDLDQFRDATQPGTRLGEAIKAASGQCSVETRTIVIPQAYFHNFTDRISRGNGAAHVQFAEYLTNITHSKQKKRTREEDPQSLAAIAPPRPSSPFLFNPISFDLPSPPTSPCSLLFARLSPSPTLPLPPPPSAAVVDGSASMSDLWDIPGLQDLGCFPF